MDTTKLGGHFPPELQAMIATPSVDSPEEHLSGMGFSLMEDDEEEEKGKKETVKQESDTSQKLDPEFQVTLSEFDGSDDDENEPVTSQVSVPVFKKQTTNVLGVKEMLDAMPFVKIRTRLVISLLLTDPAYADLQKRVSEETPLDSVYVEEGVGGEYDFVSPMRIGNDKGREGFLRSPLIRLIKNIDRWNASKFYYQKSASSDADDDTVSKMTGSIQAAYSKAVYKSFSPSTEIAQEKNEKSKKKASEDYEIGDDDTEYTQYRVEHLLSPTSYVSTSTDDAGILQVNVNLNLAHHNLALYASGDKFKMINRLYNNLSQAVEKYAASKSITVALAVVIDNEMLKDAAIRELVNDLCDGRDDLKFDMYTSSTLLKTVEGKADYVKSEFEEIWTELEEVLPSNVDDIDKILPTGGSMLFITTAYEDKTV